MEHNYVPHPAGKIRFDFEEQNERRDAEEMVEIAGLVRVTNVSLP